MALHDQLLDTLVDLGEVSLVASLRDESLGFPDVDDLRIFLGDMHLISDRRQKEVHYKYGTNHEELLTEVITKIGDLKSAVEADSGHVNLYQTGDFLDLWREAPGFDASLDAAARIKDDHEDLLTALLARSLRTSFLFGNHDLDLYRWPAYRAWARRFYLPVHDGGPARVLVTHGDVFDAIEHYPDFAKNLAVYYFSPVEQVPSFDLGVVRDLTIREHGARTYLAGIRDESPPEVGPLLRMGDHAVPARYNVQREGTASPAALQYLAEGRKACSEANQAYGLELSAVVIGHTHHARIAVGTAGAHPFTLIDCGAWIEQNLSGGQAVLNAQVAAISGNEARIYQLAPKAKAPPAIASKPALRGPAAGKAAPTKMLAVRKAPKSKAKSTPKRAKGRGTPGKRKKR